QPQDCESDRLDDTPVTLGSSERGDRIVERRRFMVAVAGGFLAAPLIGEAQQLGKTHRIGVLATFSHEHPQPRQLSAAFRQGLREQGYVEGQNIVIESRLAEGKPERLPDLFAELARLKVELILSLGGTPAARAAKQANIMIPVVAPGMADPVRDGLIASL